VIFLDADVHFGHPDFVEAQRQIFQGKGTFVVNLGHQLRMQQSPGENGFRSKENASSNWIIVGKACVLCRIDCAPLDQP